MSFPLYDLNGNGVAEAVEHPGFRPVLWRAGDSLQAGPIGQADLVEERKPPAGGDLGKAHDFSNPYLVNRLAKYTDGDRSSPFRMCVNCGADDNSVSRARPCLQDRPWWRKEYEERIAYAMKEGDLLSVSERKPATRKIPWMPYSHLVGGPTKL